ncbi:MAG TPA: tetratricopeptide repeat protein [Pseudomonadota bacterium]|nr:tetratricopeptide repeat protein [Pseudomonadota bacterium]
MGLFHLSGLPIHVPIWALTVLLLLCGSDAIAAVSNGDVADAQYRTAAKEFAAGRYEKALAAFEASLELEPSPNTRFRMAQCQLLLGKVASAYLSFRRAAEEAAGRLKATNEKRFELTRKAAIIEAAAIEAKVPRLTVAVPAQVPDGYSVSIDDVPLPRAAWGVAIEIDPGSHRVAAEGPRLRRYQSSIELRAGGQQRVDLPIQRIATASVALLYRSKPTGLAAYLDDQPLAFDQLEIRHDLDVGHHRVRVTAPGYAPFAWSAELADGEQRTVHVRLSLSGGTPRWAFYTVAATAAVAAAVGAGIAIQSQTASTAEQEKPIREREEKARDAIRDNVGAMSVAFGIAGALGLTSVILGATTRWRERDPAEKGPRMALRAIPLVTPTQAGLHISAEF